MNRVKFTMNALLVIVAVFSAISFFFTVRMYDMAKVMYIINDYYPIEGTDLSVKYTTRDECGIYRGMRNSAELMLEGNFGYDWGAAVCGGDLYINEYTTTDSGLMLSDLVRIDMETFDKEVVLHNAMLRGRCASGELVCIGEYMPPSNKPEVNSLCTLFCMTASDLRPGDPVVDYLDPGTGEVVYSMRDRRAADSKVDFESIWLRPALEEVMQ